MNKWWWLTGFDPRFSREEIDARAQLGGVAGVVFVLLMVPQFALLPAKWNTSVGALITVVSTAVASVFLTRPICAWFWPDTITAGDRRATQRTAKEKLDH